MPIIFGIAFLGRDVIVLLASQKYADASPLLPVLATGILLGSVNFLLSIGLMFQRRTTVIAYLTIGAGLFNILLNVLLIPAHGVMGSAWATLITYLIYPFVSYRLSSRFMRLEFYPASLARSAMAAAEWSACVACTASRWHRGIGPRCPHPHRDAGIRGDDATHRAASAEIRAPSSSPATRSRAPHNDTTRTPEATGARSQAQSGRAPLLDEDGA